MSDKHYWETVDAIFSEKTGVFDRLVKVAGLDPRSDFRDRSLLGIDFTGADLRGFDFSGSDLRGTCVEDARSVDKTTIFSDGTVLDDDAKMFLAAKSLLKVSNSETQRP